MTDSSTPTDGSRDGNGARASEISYDIGEDELPSEAVVRAAAVVTDTPVTDLDPLFDAVDPDHLDALFDGSRTDPDGGGRSVTFTFNECHVSVTGQEIVVRRSGEAAD